MANLEQLYQEYLGRAPDPEGLAYWTNMFGSNIDPTEQAIFKQATDDARTAGIEPPTPAPGVYLFQNSFGWLVMVVPPGANNVLLRVPEPKFLL